MQAAKIKKQRKNYLELLPTDSLAKIIFYLDEQERNKIQKMPEFGEALQKYADYLKILGDKAIALINEDKDLKSAAALVKRHRRLITISFCKAMANWTENHRLETTLEVATAIHASAKEIDPTCTVGKIMACDSQVYRPHPEADNFGFDAYQWAQASKEYVKVIWIRFGNITVHYWFKPMAERSSDDPRNYGELELNVYTQTTKRQLIIGKVHCNWEEHDYEEEEEMKSSLVQFEGDILRDMDSNSPYKEEEVVLATAIGIVAEVGRTSKASTVLFSYARVLENDRCVVENAACALRSMGFSFEQVKPQHFREEPEFRKVFS
jgi:hypothetical protein